MKAAMVQYFDILDTTVLRHLKEHYDWDQFLNFKTPWGVAKSAMPKGYREYS